MTEGAQALRRHAPRCRPWPASRCRPVCGTRTTPIPHTTLGQSADLVVVAPATARLLGAYAAGLLDRPADQRRCWPPARPVIVCPAMHTEMWEHPAVADNIATLRRRGVHIVEPDGRSPRRRRLRRRPAGRTRARSSPRSSGCSAAATLDGLHVVVTAGGTREPIDAVRVIANRSSGKQGYAVAAEALALGARVTLVSTVDLPVPPGADRASRRDGGSDAGRGRCSWPRSPTS